MKQSGRKWLVLLIAVLAALAALTLTACGFGTPTGDDKDPDGTGGSQKEEIDDLKSDRVSEAEWYDAFDKVFDTPARTANFTMDSEFLYRMGDETAEDAKKFLFAGGKIYAKVRYATELETRTDEEYYEYNRSDGKWYRYDREESGDWVKAVAEYMDSDESLAQILEWDPSSDNDYADYTYNSSKGYYERSIEGEDGYSTDIVVKFKDGNLVYFSAEGTDGADEGHEVKFYFYDYGTTKVTLPTIDDGDPDDNDPDDTNPDDNDDFGNPAKREEIDNTASDRVSEAEWNAAWAKVTTEPIRTANFTADIVRQYLENGAEDGRELGVARYDTGRSYSYYHEKDADDVYGEEVVFYLGYDRIEGRWYRYRQTDDGNYWLKYLDDYYEPDETVGFGDILETISFSDYSYNKAEGCYQATVIRNERTYHYSVKIRDGRVVSVQANDIISDDWNEITKYYFYDYGTTEVSLPTDIANTDGFEYYEAYDYSDGEDIFLGWAISGYHGNDREVTIPAEFLGDPVVEIGVSAFEDCISLTSVTIPDSVTSISSSAFEGCTSLTSVTIPDGVTSIGYSAFEGCDSLNAVYISDIAAWCAIDFNDYESNPLYYAHNLYLNEELVTEAVIPDGVTSIGYCTFLDCTSLTRVTIPASVTSIGQQAFSGCTALTTIYYEGTRAEWDAVDRGWDWIDDESAVRIVCDDDDPRAIVPLPDMVAYGDNAANYNVPFVSYGAAKAVQSALLATKQAKLLAEYGYTSASEAFLSDRSVPTYVKLFCAADPDRLIDCLSRAGLGRTTMEALVDYVTRSDDNAGNNPYESPYGLVVGRVSLFRDYPEYLELKALLAEEDEEDYGYKQAQNHLQLKERKIVGEFAGIFGEDGAAFARCVTEILSYAYQVVEEMVEQHNVDNETGYDFNTYFKTVFFDYETLVYFLAFDETVALNKSTFTPTDRKNITTLYGYYYQFLRQQYIALSDEDYFRYVILDLKEQKTDGEALEFAGLKRQQYALGIRYSFSSYRNFRTAHFQFEAKREKYDKVVYTGGSVINGKEIYANGIGNAISGYPSITYSSEMMQGHLVGREAYLKNADLQYIALGIDADVTRLNRYYNEYLNRSSSVADKIKIVRYNKEVLSQQYAVLTSDYMSSADFSNLMKMQIKLFSADYIKEIQEVKKRDVILNEELKRLAADGLQTGDAEYDEKLEEIGRNRAMLPNLTANWTAANIDSQMTSANSVEWKSESSTTGATIESEMKAALAIDYETYHQKNQGANAVYVDEYFEKNLIKKKWSCGGTDHECKNGNWHLNCAEEYDTGCKISRLLNNHDTVFRHAAGQIEISYQKVDVGNYEIEKVEASGYSHIAGPNGTPGTLSKDAKTRPIQTAYTDGQKDTYQSDEYISLPEWRGGGQGTNGWLTPTQGESDNPARLPALPRNTTGVGTSFTMVKGDYTYFFEFVGWYLDTDLKYEVRPEDTFQYDVKLYPGYKINKVRNR